MPVRFGDFRLAAMTDDVLGEVPLWHPGEHALYWIDFIKPALHRLDPGRSEVGSWKPPQKLGAFGLRWRKGFVVTGRTGVALWSPEDDEFTPIASPEDDRPSNIMNDGRCDAHGRFLFGSMDRAISRPSGRLWSVEPGADPVLLLDGDILVPNGLCWSPCGRTLYFGDSRHEHIFAFDYDVATGAVSNRRSFADTSGLPGTLDGCTVDADGFVWHARFGGGLVVRFDPDGRIDQQLPVPSRQPTHLAFGGPDLRTIYVTTGRFRMAPERLEEDRLTGGLLAIDVDVSGLPEHLYAG